MLGSCDTSFKYLIESFPRLLLLSVESHLKPMVKFLEDIGVPTHRLGHVLLLYPPLLFLDIKRTKAALEPFGKVRASCLRNFMRGSHFVLCPNFLA